MQTTVESRFAKLVGGLADGTRIKDCLSKRSAEASAEIPFGLMVSDGTALVFSEVFTAANATEIFTAAAHGLKTGDGPFQVSNGGGGLPAGLSAVTDYWFIKIDADTFYLATSRANALAGTHLAITTNGTGTQTMASTDATQSYGDSMAKLLSARTDRMIGVSAFNQAFARGVEIGDTGVKPKCAFNVLNKGRIYVMPEDDVWSRRDHERAGLRRQGLHGRSRHGSFYGSRSRPAHR